MIIFIHKLTSELIGGSVYEAASKLLAPLQDAAATSSALQALTSAAKGLKHQAEGTLELMAAELAERCVNVIKQLKVWRCYYHLLPMLL